MRSTDQVWTSDIHVLYCVGPVHGPRRCWIPMLNTKLSNSCATTVYTSMDGYSSSADEEREPMLLRPGVGRSPADDIPLYRLDGRQSSVTAVALLPVIVPVVPAVALAGVQLDPTVPPTAVHLQRRPTSLRRHSSNPSNREVKFDETVL